jgi:hypothetical protein
MRSRGVKTAVFTGMQIVTAVFTLARPDNREIRLNFMTAFPAHGTIINGTDAKIKQIPVSDQGNRIIENRQRYTAVCSVTVRNRAEAQGTGIKKEEKQLMKGSGSQRIGGICFLVFLF